MIAFNLHESWTKNNGRSDYPKQWQAFNGAFSDMYEAMRLLYDDAKIKNDALWCKSAKNLAIGFIYEASINLWCDLTTLR